MSYVQNTDDDRAAMLDAIGVSSFDELITPIAPELRVEGELATGAPMSEAETLQLGRGRASENTPASAMASFLGGGIYDRHIPAAVRYILSRSEFYTSYTPYQAEVSQGTLQAIYEYQSLIVKLTAMDAANASLYDGATALAEAVMMACSIKRVSRALVPAALPAAVRRLLATYAAGRGIAVEEIPFGADGTFDMSALGELLAEPAAAVVLAQPNYFGVIEEAPAVTSLAHEKGALLVAAVDPFSLALLAPPGEWDADIVVGEGQALGNPMNFGGPLLGFFASKKQYLRRCPGRLISATLDREGKRGYVMTLQTREQHIRREKATSNICTNEGLCALAAGAYLSALGETGFREVARQSAAKAHALRRMLDETGAATFPFAGRFFQEFVLQTLEPAARFIERARKRDVLAGIPLAGEFPALGENALLVAVTEKRTMRDLETFRDLVAASGGGR
ncbi:MAG TPA: aminomethyl-transferring glycine dehydrogenase subunit GcvPA [Alphaproteobacteria bacterium]|nr:aminomethyl-transferring glycine dehydrogenase subunit GcvPA [Alphaproteobacteria bacterium]